MSFRGCLARLRNWFVPARPAAPGVRLRLEALEARDVPAASANDTFLAAVYQGFLGRAIDPAALSFWEQALASTGSRAVVVTGVLVSPEYRGRELQLLYSVLLGRPLDSGGLAYWGNLLARGVTFEEIKAGLLSSDELFTHIGGTDATFLNALFNSQLGRAPTADEVSNLEFQLQGGTPRLGVAYNVIIGAEARAVQVTNFYREILGRAPEGPEPAFWSSVLGAGATDDFVLGAVAGSDEFFGQLTSSLNATPADDPNVAANQFLSGGLRFSSTLPGAEQLDRFLPTDPTLWALPSS